MKILMNRLTGHYVSIEKQLQPNSFDSLVVFKDRETMSVGLGSVAAERLASIFLGMFDEKWDISIKFEDAHGNNLYADAELRETACGYEHTFAVAKFISDTYKLVELDDITGLIRNIEA